MTTPELYVAADAFSQAPRIHEWVPSLVEKLKTATASTTHPALQAYALVDTAFDHYIEDKLSAQPQYPLYDRGRWEALQSHSPVLIPLPLSDDSSVKRTLQTILTRYNGYPAVSWVCSTLSAEALVDAWQPMLAARMDDDQPMLLRLADTRVSATLPQVLSAHNWAQLTAPLTQWWIINRYGKLQTLPVAPAAILPADTSDASKSLLQDVPSFELSANELDAMLRVGLADVVINAIWKSMPEALPAGPQRTPVYERVVQVCELAQRYKLESFKDVSALATLVVLTDAEQQDDAQPADDLLKQPALHELLADPDWQRGTLMDQLDRLEG